MRHRILVVAEDVTLRSTLARWLMPAGYIVELAETDRRAREVLADGRMALTIVAPSAGVPMFDLGENGGKLIVAIERSQDPGRLSRPLPRADAYLSIPLDQQEVLAQVESLLRSPPDAKDAALQAPESLSFDGFTIDLAGRSLRDCGGGEVPLTRAEFALLVVLARHPGRVLSRDQLLDAALGRRAEPYDRSIDVLVGRLRRKIEPDPKVPRFIVTMLGEGYKFAAPLRESHSAAQPTFDAPAEVEPSAPSTERRQATVMSCVAGYSRLMGEDEEGTHGRLKAHLRQLVEPKITEHRGRIVKNTGDRFLVEFASVLDAVRCAIEIQRGMGERNAETSEDKRITFCIGINLGDVIVEEHDIFGDGVNVAARLEGLAEPGGICISRVVRDQVRDKLPCPFEDWGKQSVKNIVRPVRVFALRLEAITELPVTGAQIAMPRRRGITVTAIVATVGLVLAVVSWWLWPMTTPSPTATLPGVAATSVIQPPVAPRLSIVVLPFVNLSNDPEQQYFADGITEDLTTDLSRIADMLVISRNSAFTYKDKPVNARQIGRELGVRYVLEGAVRRSDNQVRVNAELIDAETDAHLWAERFDRGMGDLFALQDAITRGIAVALNLEILAAEVARATENNPDALDYILQGRAALAQPPGLDNYGEAINAFEHALALDPQSIEAKGWLANALVGRVLDLHPGSSWSDLKRAYKLVSQALATSPSSTPARLAKGQLLRVAGRCDEAIPEFEMVIASNRNSVGALFALGECKLLTGSIDEAIPLVEQAVRLGPRDPYVFNRYLVIGKVHLLQSHIEEAIVWLERARIGNPGSPWPNLWLASACALKGETDHAAAELAEARRLLGESSFSSIAQLTAHGYWGVPKVRALFEATYFAGLRKAGLPEE
jgi:adenylate cyclase